MAALPAAEEGGRQDSLLVTASQYSPGAVPEALLWLHLSVADGDSLMTSALPPAFELQMPGEGLPWPCANGP